MITQLAQMIINQFPIVFETMQKNDFDLIDKIKSDYLIYFQNWLANTGINPFIARIMQLLRFEDRPVTQGEMQMALGLSKATISRNLKVMEELNLLKINILPTGEKSGDKYTYELKERSLFYIFSKFLKNIYESFNRRKDDNRIVMDQINKLDEVEKNNLDIQNLLRIMMEEEVVFDSMISKFDRLIQDIDKEMYKASK